MKLSSSKILIVGGGLAGLSAAIALSQRGATVTVVDRQGQAEGASIAITNRAVDALEALGVLEAAIAAGMAPSGPHAIFTSMMDAAGNKLPSMPAPPRPDDGLPALVAIYRPRLAEILSGRAQALGASVWTGASFRQMSDDGAGVEIVFEDGARDRFDLVIGADGTRSSVRDVIIPDLKPAYTGWMSFRIMLEDGPPGDSGFFMLPSSNMIATTRLPGNLLYLATSQEMENRRLSQDQALACLDEVLSQFTAPLIVGIRERLKERPHVIARPFEWLMVPEPWHRGRVVVVGDAAHSTTAHLSSGGSMAIEDGVVLAEELDKGASLEAGLNAFVRRRFERTSLVVDASVELLRLQERRAHPAEGARLRAQAVGALMQPY